jgi:membrane-bound lytic murein transglycosylase D
VPVSKSIGSSRVLLPAAGGQTIRVPAAMMGDAYELWSPVRESERKPLRRVPDIPAGAFVSRLAAQLSPPEAEEMRSYLYRLTQGRRDLAFRVLERAEHHLPVILEALSARGLPAELACLPMVESAFEPRAVSPAGAAGLWQLMPETARRFGLTVNSEIDERFDVRKSTAAAAAYLAALHALFKDWPLALAAYNCGEGAMLRALSHTNALTLPELARACRVMEGSGSPLSGETLRFVPQFAAAVQIMANSREFGLTDQAMLRTEPRTASARDAEPPLALVGRYETAPESGNRPARSRRIP